MKLVHVVTGEPITMPEGRADPVAEFREGLLSHLRAGYDAQRELLKARWEFAVWLRPYVQHGGDRRSEIFKTERVPPWSPRAVFEAMRAADEVSIRWPTLLRYLPLADHDWDTLAEHAHTVKAALAWCADQKRTPEERDQAKAERRARKTAAKRREERDAAIIRKHRAEITALRRQVADAKTAADPSEVRRLRRERDELAAKVAEQDRKIEDMGRNLAHLRRALGQRENHAAVPLSLSGDRPRWCNACANPPSLCQCLPVANGGGRVRQLE